MHDQGISPALAEDQRKQGAVLAFVLSEHPTQLTLGDLMMEIVDEDAVARAVRDLVAVGLLRRNGDSLLPTLAALRFDWLDV
jgi:hypothetical protein